MVMMMKSHCTLPWPLTLLSHSNELHVDLGFVQPLIGLCVCVYVWTKLCSEKHNRLDLTCVVHYCGSFGNLIEATKRLINTNGFGKHCLFRNVAFTDELKMNSIFACCS